MKWLATAKDGFACPKCGHGLAWVLKRRRIRECDACRWQASPTAGMLFENTRLPPKQVVSCDLDGRQGRHLGLAAGSDAGDSMAHRTVDAQ